MTAHIAGLPVEEVVLSIGTTASGVVLVIGTWIRSRRTAGPPRRPRP
jgi:hypothetical protein